MKLDMDLVRQILIVLEDLPAGELYPEFQIDGATPETIGEHLRLMAQAGLVEGVVTTNTTTCKRMTWDGHQFLAACRDQTLWNKAKATALAATKGVSLIALKAALDKLATAAVNSM